MKYVSDICMSYLIDRVNSLPAIKRFNKEDVMVADIIAKLLAFKSQSMKYLSYRRPIQIYKPIHKCKDL